ncbi:MAG: Hpt domain-containing protein, partial [Desulfobulbaceae bacterium]|nr:Hpt domain-containing protein [Desulfobulbaceae bacterium]
MTDPYIDTYREEACERLAELETSLLELEERPDDMELVNQVFRAMHTIKGSGAMFGFDDIAAFTHEVETVFDMVRNGKMVVTKRLLDLTLKSRDYISVLLDASAGLGEVNKNEGDEIIENLHQLVSSLDTPKASVVPTAVKPVAPKTASSPDTERKTWRIRFRPNRELLLSGSNPIALLNELRGLGSCHVIANFADVPLLHD